jgi:hypothetical protein
VFEVETARLIDALPDGKERDLSEPI